MNSYPKMHVVAFTLKPGISREDPRVRTAAAISAAHPEVIPEIKDWVYGWDTSYRNDSADFLVVGTFHTDSDYAAFQAHPDHQRGKEAWIQVAKWIVVDINLDNNHQS